MDEALNFKGVGHQVFITISFQMPCSMENFSTSWLRSCLSRFNIMPMKVNGLPTAGLVLRR